MKETVKRDVLNALQDVYEPRIVGIPTSDATANLVELSDGTLRCYGGGPVERHAPCDRFLESRNHGLTWVETMMPEKSGPLWGLIAVGRSPISGDYYGLNPRRIPDGQWYENELVLLRSSSGPDGPYAVTVIGSAERLIPPPAERYTQPGCEIFDMPLRSVPAHWGVVRPPLFIRGGKRALVCANTCAPVMRGIISRRVAVWLSDDDGFTWRLRVLDPVGPHPISWPDRGSANQDGATEPTVIELASGRLWMLIRTVAEYHHESFSDDGGETWTKPRPSKFRGHFTMPTLHRLADGRILLMWCNTAKLPEDHRKLTDEERRQKASGSYALSNRDVLHAAVSADEGVTWSGFRELYVNPLRNDPDFATGQGGTGLGIDKSVHQPQAINLPHGKVLVATGQHPACRRLLVFDPNWLLETGRADDFSVGLDNWCTFQYVDQVKGHCARDRRPGAVLVRHPDNPDSKALHLCRRHDDTLTSDVQGAVWNFPAAQSGVFETRLRVQPGCKGGLISLFDCWVNPSDSLCHRLAMFNLTFMDDGRCGYFRLIPGRWHALRFTCNLPEEDKCRLDLDDVFAGELCRIRPSAFGISYVLFQSVSDAVDEAGFMVDNVRMTGAANDRGKAVSR